MGAAAGVGAGPGAGAVLVHVLLVLNPLTLAAGEPRARYHQKLMATVAARVKAKVLSGLWLASARAVMAGRRTAVEVEVEVETGVDMSASACARLPRQSGSRLWRVLWCS